MLGRLPAIADAIQRSRTEPLPRDPRHAPAQGTPWTLVAHEPGRPRPGMARMRSYHEARAMAVELSELGFMVTVHDREERVRLRVWPPR